MLEPEQLGKMSRLHNFNGCVSTMMGMLFFSDCDVGDGFRSSDAQGAIKGICTFVYMSAFIFGACVYVRRPIVKLFDAYSQAHVAHNGRMRTMVGHSTPLPTMVGHSTPLPSVHRTSDAQLVWWK